VLCPLSNAKDGKHQLWRMPRTLPFASAARTATLLSTPPPCSPLCFCLCLPVSVPVASLAGRQAPRTERQQQRREGEEREEGGKTSARHRGTERKARARDRTGLHAAGRTNALKTKGHPLRKRAKKERQSSERRRRHRRLKPPLG
jgi:hypothetical protein